MSKPVIICVDDEQTILDSLEVELQKTLGDEYLIETAQSSEEALQLLSELLEEQYEVPVVIVDYLMPNIKGDELLKRIHAISPKTLKIMLTGQPSLEAVGNAIKYAKLYRYIAKPWETEDLRLTVKEAVNSYLQDKKLAQQNVQLQQMNQELAKLNCEQAVLITKLQENESRLIQFLEAMPVGVGVLDAEGKPYYINQKAKKIFGKEVKWDATTEQLSEIYQVYKAGTHQEYPIENLPLVQALRGRSATANDIEIHINGKIINLETRATPIYDVKGNIAYAIDALEDITERKQAEKLLADYNRTLEKQVAERTLKLRQQKELLQTIFDHIPVMVVLYDAKGQIQLVNRELERVLGWSDSELEDLDRLAEYYLDQKCCQQVVEHAIAGTGKWQDFKIRTQDGSYVETSWAGIGLSHGMSIGIGQDITERLDAALRDREYAEAASVLEERNRMAREIHDILAQSFTGILLHIQAATQVLTDDLEATQAHLKMIDELARTGLAEARRSVAALRPQLLEEGNLHTALHCLMAQMRSNTDTSVIYEIKGTAYSLPAEVENNLLRIGQEALTNAIKYADAGEIRIELVYDNTQCILRVKDDGRGFGVARIPSGGFGLLGMSERAEHLGAQLSIQSEPGQGTEIVVIVNRE
ncbi:PAS domain S-box protein [Nostoc sp. FACHB-133]|uniref:PAS domain S-box protein n=1 Tax=Nostoc sp. FACHB-133 TaxID=2692835 RepID=UPI0016830C8E|nr:PAS domain S-box protein [Nostoc sp. FACHB-133]MBD2527609.1 PAS domain S-box protein [Nostoc sp. FACHB-133]